MSESIEIRGRVVLVDSEDAHRLRDYLWGVFGPKGKDYVKRRYRKDGRLLSASLHREVIGAVDGEIVDHINGDRFDNRRANLRIVDASQNARNAAKRSGASSRFRGVTFDKDAGKWRVSIRTDSGKVNLGKFENECEAAFVYDCASLAHHKEYGRRNFLPLV